jgi:hypothetical protein
MPAKRESAWGGRRMGKDGEKWSVSPDGSNEILNLTFDKEFGLLLDMSGDARTN